MDSAKDARARSATSTRPGRQITRRGEDRADREARDPARVEGRLDLAERTAKLQATGYDKAGRKQYLYHADFRAAQEQAKYDKLIRFAEKLPGAPRDDGRRISTRTSSTASASRRSRCG